MKSSSPPYKPFDDIHFFQEMGEKEATVALFCPKAAYDEPKVRKVNE